MKKVMVVCVLVLFLCASCTTVKNVEGTNADGSPVWTTEVPFSKRCLYGVGRAKFSNAQNSEKAAEVQAYADLARKVTATIKESTAVYANDSSSTLAEAFESIVLVSTNVTLKEVMTVDKWMSPEGEAWALVSLETKKLKKIYQDAANDYLNQLEEKKIAAEKKLAALLEKMGTELDEEESLLKELAEEKVSSIEKELDEVKAILNHEKLSQNFADALSSQGFDVE